MTSTPTASHSLEGEILSDDELCEMALAADPDRPFDEDARPFADTSASDGPLPAWYMPVARTGNFSTWHRAVVAIVVLAFLVINALGLCITYGVLEIA